METETDIDDFSQARVEKRGAWWVIAGGGGEVRPQDSRDEAHELLCRLLGEMIDARHPKADDAAARLAAIATNPQLAHLAREFIRRGIASTV
ncbi:MAG: hypothetical protein IT461_03190 [Planctomycetes bacterium]|jgi:hypothetical protein|nr:hypothetical protein [Planctomycetota bacterium]